MDIPCHRVRHHTIIRTAWQHALIVQWVTQNAIAPGKSPEIKTTVTSLLLTRYVHVPGMVASHPNTLATIVVYRLLLVMGGHHNIIVEGIGLQWFRILPYLIRVASQTPA